MESFPKVRVIDTRHARPRLASQAPKVKTTKGKNISWGLKNTMDSKIIMVRPKIMPSKARSLIKMWER